MAKKAKAKQPEFKHCRVVLTSHPSAPWRVSYPIEVDGKTRRKRRMFSTEQKATDFATEHEREVSDFGVRFGAITAEARRAFDYFRDARHDLRTDGIDPPTFEALVMAAVDNLRREHADRQRDRMTAAEAVEEFLAYKAPRIGPRHAEGLKGELGRFAKEFGDKPLDSLTAGEVEDWLAGLRSPRGGGLLGATTRNKTRKSIKSLFKYGMASARGWCQSNPLSDTAPEKVLTAEPQAYSPGDAVAILQAALDLRSPLLPSLALGFFAGLRPSETMTLDLSVIDLAGDEFRVPSNTKTGARIAPLTPACRAWLAAQTRRTGKAFIGNRQGHSTEMRAVLTAAKVTGIYDGPRHSFITYRTAETRDVARVADECGNSPNVIKKHYREIVTGAAAKKYFSIRPDAKAENVTNIEEGKKSA
jgi:integrase